METNIISFLRGPFVVMIYLRFYVQVAGYESSSSLNHFVALVSFYTTLKHRNTKGFQMFSGGIERDQSHEIGKENEVYKSS